MKRYSKSEILESAEFQLRAQVDRAVSSVGACVAETVLTLMNLITQQERESAHNRQQEGIVAAKARGVRFGRPVRKAPENFAEVVKLLESKKITLEEALAQTGLKQATFYNRLRELRNGKKK